MAFSQTQEYEQATIGSLSQSSEGNKLYKIQAIVEDVLPCPPCPADSYCKACPPDRLVILENIKNKKPDMILVLGNLGQGINPSLFEKGKKYDFFIKMGKKDDSGNYVAQSVFSNSLVAELISFNPL